MSAVLEWLSRGSRKSPSSSSSAAACEPGPGPGSGSGSGFDSDYSTTTTSHYCHCILPSSLDNPVCLFFADALNSSSSSTTTSIDNSKSRIINGRPGDRLSSSSSPASDSLSPDSPDYSLPSSQSSPPLNEDPRCFTMPTSTTSPIDIATPTRNASSSPSSQGKQNPNFHDTDSRTSAIMSGIAYDSSMGRGRQDSFAGAKPISMANPNRDPRPRRESLAGSLVGGMSWGGVSVGSWIRDEYVCCLVLGNYCPPPPKPLLGLAPSRSLQGTDTIWIVSLWLEHRHSHISRHLTTPPHTSRNSRPTSCEISHAAAKH